MAYSKEYAGLLLPIAYSDGSQAKSFPVGGLNKKHGLEHAGREMHIGMTSERHASLDRVVSMYWFLNIEISGRGQTAAEIDAFCYKRSREMFRSILEQNKGVCIYFYQSGFPFAVIGFYRALAELLLEQQSRDLLQSVIRLVPMYFRGDDNPYEQGQIWE